jgi:hypothetical protein
MDILESALDIIDQTLLNPDISLEEKKYCAKALILVSMGLRAGELKTAIKNMLKKIGK